MIAFFLLTCLIIILFSFSISAFVAGNNVGAQVVALSQSLFTGDGLVQHLAPYLLAAVMVVSFCLPVYAIVRILKKRSAKVTPETKPKVVEEPEIISFDYKVVLLIGFSAFILVQIYQHFRFSLPISTDARIYLYQLEQVTIGANHLGAWRIVNLLPTILTFGLFFPVRAVGLSWDVIIKFAPIVLGVLFLVATFFFVKKNSNSKVVASFSVVLAGLSLQTLAISTVLFRNLLSLSLLLVFLTLYLSYLSDHRKLFGLSCTLVLLLLFAQDSFTGIFLTLMLLIFNVIHLVRQPKNGLRILKNTLMMYIPIPVAVLVLDAYNYYLFGKLEQPISAFIPSLIQGGFSISSFSPLVWVSTFQNNWQSAFLENTYILFFSIAGIIALCYSLARGGERKFNFAIIMLSWIVSITFITCVTNIQEGYRFVLNYPMPIVGTIGLLFIIEKLYLSLKRHDCHFKGRHLSFTRKLWSPTKYLALIAFALILTTSALVRIGSSSYFEPYSLPSSEQSTLQWIRSEYSNQKTIFVMKTPGWSENESTPYYWQWAAYYFLPEISNISLYTGNLSALLNGEPSSPLSSMMQRPAYSQEMLKNYSILLVDTNQIGTYYRHDIVEESILIPVHQFVHQVKNLTSAEIEFWTKSWNKFQETGQLTPREIAFEDSSLKTDWLPHQGNLTSNGLNAEMSLDFNKTDMWLDRGGLSIDSSYYNYLEIQANPHGGTIALDFYDSNVTVLGTYSQFPSWNGQRTFYLKLSDIVSNKTVSRIAIVFMSQNATDTCTLYNLAVFDL